MKKLITSSLLLAVIFAGCATDKKSVETPKITSAIASDATESEIEKEVKYEKHIEKVKKRKSRQKRLRTNSDKKVVDLKKFCFKDSKSIHYKANQRCK